MIYYYYSITNLINNKKYCGITKDIHNRYLKHKRELKNGCHHSIKLQNAVNKYGLDNFVFKLEGEKDFDNIIEAYEYEKIFINKNNSYKDGYNMTDGGLGCLSPESYIKTKATWQEKVDDVIQIDKTTYSVINIFSSLREAERQTGLSHGNIGRVCNRQDISCGGFYWCFSKDWSENWIPPLNQKYKPIALLDKDDLSIVRVFQSCAEAARQMNVDRSNLRTSILRDGTCNGNKYRYISLEEYELYACRD